MACITTAVKALKTGDPASAQVFVDGYPVTVACKLLVPSDARYATGGQMLVMLRVDHVTAKAAGLPVDDLALDWLLIQQEAALGALVLTVFDGRAPPFPGQALRHCFDLNPAGGHIITKDRFRTALWTIQRRSFK
jgi:hypothetical protein